VGASKLGATPPASRCAIEGGMVCVQPESASVDGVRVDSASTESASAERAVVDRASA
jgi:hypothetical protein